ncbi:MAG: PAS domain S-box protein [Anaerolineae bacterium]|nr:PAS domain S-box protein [Anaerolineae bacterium]
MGDEKKTKAQLVRELNTLRRRIVELEQRESAQAEALLHDDEERYRMIAEYTYDWEYWRAPGGKIVYTSRSCERITGYRAEEFVEDSIFLNTIIHPDDLPAVEQHNALVQQREDEHTVHELEFRVIRKDGKERWIGHTCRSIHRADGTSLGRHATNRDITERKQAEETIRSLARFPSENPDPVLRVDRDGNLLYANEAAFALLTDWKLEMGQPVPESLVEPTTKTFETQMMQTVDIRCGEHIFSFAVAPVPGDEYANLYARNVTERVRAEERTRKLNRIYAVLSDVNQTIVRVRETKVLLEQICRIAVEKGGFRLAWIGLVDPQTIEARPVAYAGVIDNYLEKLCIVLNDDESGVEPAASALRTGERVIANDIENDQRMAPWREDAMRPGYRASAAFPLIVSGEVRGALSLYASEPGFFDDAEIKLLDEMALDVSFALEYAEQETHRKRAEESLRWSETALKKAQQVSHVGSWTWHIQTGRLEWSDEMYRIFGIEKEIFSGDLSEVIGRAIHPDDRAAVEQSNRSVIQNKKPIPLEYRVIRPDGTVRTLWAEAGELILDEAGKSQTLTGIVQDITEHKQAEEALRKSEALFHSLVESLPQNVFSKDLQGRFTFANQRYCATEEKSLDDILGQTDFDLHPPDLAAKYRSDDLRVMETGQIVDVVEEHQPIDGNKSYVQVIKAPLYDGQGDVAGVLGIFWDITERKRVEEALRKSEAQLSNAMKIARLGYWEYDVVSDSFTFNDHFYSIFRTSVEREGSYEMSSARYTERFVHPDDRPVVAIEIQKTLEATDPLYSRQFEHRMLYSDGEIGYIAVRFFIEKDDQGRTIKTFGANQDITERKQTEEALKHQATMLDLAPASITVHDLDGRFLYANERTLELHGYTRSEFMAMTIHQIDVPASKELIAERIELLKRIGATTFEVAHYCKDGSSFPLDVAVRIVEWGGQTVILSIGKDITERKQAEEALRLRMEQLSAISQASQAVAVSLDLSRVLAEVVTLAGKVTESDYASVILVDESGRVSGGFEDLTGVPTIDYRARPKGFTGWIARSRLPVLVDEIDKAGVVKPKIAAGAPRTANPLLTEKGIKSFAGLPLVVEERIVGVLYLYSLQTGAFHDQVFLLTAFANQAAIAIEKARLYEAVRKELAERKQAEKFLRDSETRLKRAQEIARLGSWIYDLSGRLSWSDETYRIYGVSPDTFTLTNESFIRLVHPDDRAAVQVCVNAYRSGKQPDDLEFRVILPDGSVRVISGRGEIVYDAEGQPIHIAGTAQDITERKQTEEALKQRALQLLLLNDISRRVASVMDPDKLLETTASLIYESFGYEHVGIFIIDPQSKNDLVMKAKAGVYTSRFPVDYRLKLGQGMIGWVALYGRRLLANDVSTEMRFQDPFDDQTIKAELSVPIQSDQGVIGVIDIQSRQQDAFGENDVIVVETLSDVLAVAMHNIRLYRELEAYSGILSQAVEDRTVELKRVKEHVEAILDCSPDGLLVLSTAGKIQTANPAFYEMYDHGIDDITNTPLTDLYDTDQIGVVTDALSDVLRTGKSRRVSLIARRQDGTTFDADVALAPVMDNEIVSGIVCSIRDISALKEVERMKDAFVSNVSHELRTPIASMKLNHDLIARNPDRQSIYIGRLKREIDRLNTLIEDLLRLSRLDQVRDTLHLEPVDLNDLAAQYVEDRLPIAESKQLEMSFNKLPRLPLVQADAGLLGQALSILITNALNYTPSGGLISVRAEKSTADGRRWAGISVADTGPGITPDELPHLYKRFHRGKVGRDSGSPGTGLGLAIASEIIDLHHGRITVSSKGVPGQGTTFTLWIPIESET